MHAAILALLVPACSHRARLGQPGIEQSPKRHLLLTSDVTMPKIHSNGSLSSATERKTKELITWYVTLHEIYLHVRCDKSSSMPSEQTGFQFTFGLFNTIS
jgi:hypothetical protein